MATPIRFALLIVQTFSQIRISRQQGLPTGIIRQVVEIRGEFIPIGGVNHVSGSPDAQSRGKNGARMRKIHLIGLLQFAYRTGGDAAQVVEEAIDRMPAYEARSSPPSKKAARPQDPASYWSMTR